MGIGGNFRSSNPDPVLHGHDESGTGGGRGVRGAECEQARVREGMHHGGLRARVSRREGEGEEMVKNVYGRGNTS